MTTPCLTIEDRVWGCMLGGIVGDALGAPMEGLHYQDIRRIYGENELFEDFTQAQLDLAAETRGWPHSPFGAVTDDSVVADLLLESILASDGQTTAYAFAKAYEGFATPVPNPDGPAFNRLEYVHWIERITYYRNRSRQINKRELGRGEPSSDNAIMCIAPVGLLCAGDPLKAELMAVDVTSVHQHGASREVAGAYAAALASCFLPGITVERIVELAIRHIREPRATKSVTAMIDLARVCTSCPQFIERYYAEIIGRYVPMQDLEQEGTKVCLTWDSAEVLGPALAMFLITRGENAREMILHAARMGRDADTIARCAGGLIGAYRGTGVIPTDWADYVLARNRWLRLREKAEALAKLIRRNLERDIQARQSVLGQG
ncbi:MAG: ADP-ribosylglycohydrolase family protein [Phycisphaeraceae bacterium]|nr:ADP-ribosylglycohydrolase family protein [Phycisphaeraceae bacterium]